ncbi:MAG: hypothetical protein JWM68_5309 [Verrucomicrobiales bacterium]|nr:hypothetical protein [Verrucomicrobiales bacterium]
MRRAVMPRSRQPRQVIFREQRQTHPHEARQIPGRSSPVGRSRSPRHWPAGHIDRPGSTRPWSPDAGPGVPAAPRFLVPVPTPRGRCQNRSLHGSARPSIPGRVSSPEVFLYIQGTRTSPLRKLCSRDAAAYGWTSANWFFFVNSRTAAHMAVIAVLTVGSTTGAQDDECNEGNGFPVWGFQRPTVAPLLRPRRCSSEFSPAFVRIG